MFLSSWLSSAVISSLLPTLWTLEPRTFLIDAVNRTVLCQNDLVEETARG